jgi:hypothetical protein
MTKSIADFSKSYDWDGTNFIQKKGPKSGQIINKNDLAALLIKDYNIDFDLIPNTIEELKQELIANKQSKAIYTTDIVNNLKEAILKENCFKDFFISKTASNTSIVYLKNNGRLSTIETLSGLGPDVFYEFLRGCNIEIARSIQKAVSPFIDKKKQEFTTAEQCIKFLLSNVFLDELIPNIIPIEQSLHPVTIEGTDILAAYTIPYTKKDVKFYDLDTHLQDFLKRTENHQYLCATIFGYLLGHDNPYLIYLKGEGGDGKSSFIKMLGKLFGGSLAPWQDNNQFSMANMFMRGIINIAESTNPLLLQQSLVKSITGGSPVNIESKNKTGFTGYIRCLLIADSNIDLRLLGKEFEVRRLRYFRVSAPNIKKGELLTQNKYVDLLNSTPNEFLNYCRQCFEELSSNNGTINPPENHVEIVDELTDPTDRDYFKKFVEVLNKDLVFDPRSSHNKGTLFKRLKADYPKDGEHKKFVETNFTDYLTRHYKIKISPSLIIGWGEPIKETEPTDKLGLSEED